MSFWSRVVRTFRPGSYSEEVEEELQYHLAMKQQDGYDDRAARIRFGNTSKLKEETRAQGIITWLESLVLDTRYGLRQLSKSSTLTLVVIFSLALGIGANSAIFTLVDAALLKSLPVKNPQALRVINWTNQGWPQALCNWMTGDSNGDPNGRMEGSSIAARVYRELAREQNGFASLIGFSDPDIVGVASGNRAAEQFKLQYVSANFFGALGVPPRLGRAFSPDDDHVGRPPLVILSDRFGGNGLEAMTMCLGEPCA